LAIFYSNATKEDKEQGGSGKAVNTGLNKETADAILGSQEDRVKP
jgi:hypothetical protein